MNLIDEQLKFMAGFATTDLEVLRSGDWSNLRDDIAGFLGLNAESRPEPRVGALVPYFGMKPPWFSDDEIRHLQGGTRLLLEYIADKQAAWSGKAGQKQPAPVVGPWFDTATRKTAYLSSEGKVFYLVDGKPDDVFFEMLFQCLGEAGSVDRILRCPVCGRLFYRNRKQQYCQRACFMKAWTQTKKGRDQKREADKKSAQNRRLAKARAKHGHQ